MVENARRDILGRRVNDDDIRRYIQTVQPYFKHWHREFTEALEDLDSLKVDGKYYGIPRKAMIEDARTSLRWFIMIAGCNENGEWNGKTFKENIGRIDMQAPGKRKKQKDTKKDTKK